jgi:hypothetical protein
MIKITGIILSILSLILVVFSVFALTRTVEMSQFLSHAITEFNIAEWQQHWRVLSIVYLVSGCIGLYAGIGIFKNRKFAFLLFSCLITLLLLVQVLLNVSGYAIFTFEKMDPIETIIMLSICIFSWYLFSRRMNKSST